jgi:hypothetical protein
MELKERLSSIAAVAVFPLRIFQFVTLVTSPYDVYYLASMHKNHPCRHSNGEYLRVVPIGAMPMSLSVSCRQAADSYYKHGAAG